MKKNLKHWFRPLFYFLLSWIQKAQEGFKSRDFQLADGQRGLDIGCGLRKRKGFVGLDKYASSGIDVVCDLESGSLPFESNTFDIVYANHVLEHIADLAGLLTEISRVMKPGAILKIGVPYAGDLRAFQDPTHVRFFTLKTFEYFVKEGSRVGGWYLAKPFNRITRRHLIFGRGPLSLLMAIVVNRSLGLLDFYEATVLRVVFARNLYVELQK